MTFTAIYRGVCAECGEQLQGTEVVYDADDNVVHAKCPDAVDDRPGGATCPRCFCFHVGECF